MSESERGLTLVTGAAGFIGFHVAKRLLERGETIVGVDNFTPYYDPSLKEARVQQLEGTPGWSLERVDLANADAVDALFERHRPRRVVHLAAQAGVRYALHNPKSYVASNLVGFSNVLEGCRHGGVEHLVYASSSSVYGASRRVPFSEHDPVDHPISLYAATKRSNELVAHTYSHLFNLPTTGLRFFTVYGPWGRPDMAYFSFTKAILAGAPIQLFAGGVLTRDFTYVDDVVESLVRLLDRPPQPNGSWSAEHPDPASSTAPYRVFNIGGHSPVKVTRLVEILEEQLGRKAIVCEAPMQPGDVPATFADVCDLARVTGAVPETTLEEGLARFVAWYRDHYGGRES